MNKQQAGLCVEQRRIGRKIITLLMALVLCVAAVFTLVPQKATADDVEATPAVEVRNFDELKQALADGKTNIAVKNSFGFSENLSITGNVTLDISYQALATYQYQIIVDGGSLNLIAPENQGSVRGDYTNADYTKTGLIYVKNGGALTVGNNVYISVGAFHPSEVVQASSEATAGEVDFLSESVEEAALESACSSAVNVVSGSVEVNGGIIENAIDDGIALLAVGSGSKITVNSGNVQTISTNDTCALCADTGAQAIITGGEFSSIYGPAVVIRNDAQANITGGTYAESAYPMFYFYNANVVLQGVSLTRSTAGVVVQVNGGGTTLIDSCSFTLTDAAALYTTEEATASITVKNCQMVNSSNTWRGPFCLSGGNITIQSGVYSASGEVNVIELYGDVVLTIENGVFNASDGGDVLWTYFDDSEQETTCDPIITINGGTFTASGGCWYEEEYWPSYALVIQGGSAVINGGTFTSEDAYAFFTYDSNITINNGSFNADASDCVVVGSWVKMVINDGSFISTNYDTVWVGANASLEINGGTYVAKENVELVGGVAVGDEAPDFDASLGLYSTAASVVLNGGYFYNGITIYPEEEDADGVEGIEEGQATYTALSQLLGKGVKYYNLVNDKPTTVYTAKDVTKTAFTTDPVAVYKEAMPMTGDWLARLFAW